MLLCMASSFQYSRGLLHGERVPLDRVAARFGTPAYVYSRAAIESKFRRFDQAFGRYPHLVCYAVKACSNLSILRLLARIGAGFDIVSGGELYRVLQAGGDPAKIVFSGVGKTAEEIDAALRAGILKFNVESECEIDLLASRASRLKKTANIAVRVNPDVAAETHPYITTGMRQHKFGLDMETAERLYLRLHRQPKRYPGLKVAGVSCHIGSQILDTAPFLEALDRLLALSRRLTAAGLSMRYLDVGGGLGVPYKRGDADLDPASYVRKIVTKVRHSGATSGLTVMLEPGRSIVGEAGMLLTRVINCKTNGDKHFVIVDAAMNDLIRPALYSAYHEILPVKRSKGIGKVADLVGPVCETGDFLARDRQMPPVKPNDLLAIATTGAYGSVQGSNYNSRCKPPEVLLDGSRMKLIRRRETVKDLIRNET
jgi:diaminopimelate decarboxylase